MCFILTSTQLNYEVTLLFNYMFQSYLCSIARVRNASDADISVIFPGFFYRHSDLEVSCSNGTKTRHGESRCLWPERVTRSDIGLHDLKHLRKGIVERMMCVLGKSGLMVVSLTPCFWGGVWGVKNC